MKWLNNLIPGRRQKLQNKYDDISNEIIYIKSKIHRLKFKLIDLDGRTKQAKTIVEIIKLETELLRVKEQELKELSELI